NLGCVTARSCLDPQRERCDDGNDRFGQVNLGKCNFGAAIGSAVAASTPFTAAAEDPADRRAKKAIGITFAFHAAEPAPDPASSAGAAAASAALVAERSGDVPFHSPICSHSMKNATAAPQPATVSGACPAVNRLPRATYRLQLRSGFGFDDARQLVPYLQSLGISELYLSPLFRFREESTHGYDVVDHSRIEPTFGDRDAFRRLADE